MSRMVSRAAEMVEGSLHLLDLLEIMASHHLEGDSEIY